MVEEGISSSALALFGGELVEDDAMTLHELADSGDVEGVRASLEAGADVNAVDKYGNTPLHEVCLGSAVDLVDLVEVLVEAGADVTAANEAGFTPLHNAAIMRGKEVVEVLLGAGADVNAVDMFGITPLHKASMSGKVKVVQALIEAGANVHAANKVDSSPLHEASKSGKVEVVQALIEAGANVHAADKEGNAPLHFASVHGAVEAVQALVQAGADVHAKDKYGNTPLHKVCLGSAVEVVGVVEVLVGAGADVNAVNESGFTPLHKASEYGEVEVLDVLLGAGADVNAADKDGNTPLHTLMAADGIDPPERRATITALKKAGADASLCNSDGLTPDQVAERFSLDTKKALVPTVRVTTTVLFWALLGAALHYFDIVSDAQVAAAFWAEQNYVFFWLVVASAGMSSLYMLYILVGDCLRHESPTVMQRLSPLIGLLQLIPAVEACRLVGSWGGDAPDYDAATEDLRVVEVAVEAVPQLVLQLYILGLLVEEGGVGSLGLLLVVSLAGSVGSMVYQYAGVTDRPQAGMTVPMWVRAVLGVCRLCMLVGRLVLLAALALATRAWGGVFVYLWAETWVVVMVTMWHTWSCRPTGTRSRDVVCEGVGLKCCWQCSWMLCVLSPCCCCMQVILSGNRTMLKSILTWSASLMVPFGEDPRELVDVPWTFVSEAEVAWSQHPSVLHRIVASVRGIMGVLILMALTIVVAVGEGSFNWVWPAVCALGVWGMGTSGALVMSYFVLGGALQRETTDPTQQSQPDAGQGASPSTTSSASPTAERGSKNKVHTMGASAKVYSGGQPSTIDVNPLREVKVVGSPLATAEVLE